MTNPSFILPSAPAYDEGILAGLNVYYDPTNFVASPMTVTRATTATRVNQDGLVELVPYNLLTYSEQFDNAAWTKAGVGGGIVPVVTPNAGTAPNGTLTADRVQFDCVSNLLSTFRSRINQSYTGIVGNAYSGSFYIKAFSPSEVGKQLRYVVENAGISNVITITADWQRIELSGTATATPFSYLLETRGTFTTNTTADVLLWGAQLVEGANALPYKRTETRLNIPRIDYSLGGCPSVLIEPQRTNLFTWSEQFDNVAWTKSTTTITANTTIAPSGLMTADTMAVSSSSSRVIAANVLTAGTYTISVWAKVLSGSGIMRFNLTIDGTPTSSNFEPTTEWQRFTYTFTAATSVTTISFRGLTFVGDLAIWGAQLVEGTEPLEYLPTTDRLDIARIDYSTGEAALLVEPQRTNLYARSENFNDWSVKVSVTTTANYDISPKGIQNGTRLQFTANGFLHDNSFVQVTGTVYTISGWAKRNDSGTQGFGFFVNGSGSINSAITLTNDWQRFTYTYTASNTSRAGFAGLSGADVSVFGFQVEAGAYPTSYIPTTSVSVTRNYDVPSLGNNYTSGRITASGGTWFSHLLNNTPKTRDSGGGIGLRLTNVAGNNMFHISTPTGSNQRYWVRKFVGGVNTDLYNTLTNEVKIAIKWNGTTADIFVNGIKVVSATAFTSVDLENLNVNNGNIPYNINAMALWSTPLTDEELITLTTL